MTSRRHLQICVSDEVVQRGTRLRRVLGLPAAETGAAWRADPCRPLRAFRIRAAGAVRGALRLALRRELLLLWLRAPLSRGALREPLGELAVLLGVCIRGFPLPGLVVLAWRVRGRVVPFVERVVLRFRAARCQAVGRSLLGGGKDALLCVLLAGLRRRSSPCRGLLSLVGHLWRSLRRRSLGGWSVFFYRPVLGVGYRLAPGLSRIGRRRRGESGISAVRAVPVAYFSVGTLSTP